MTQHAASQSSGSPSTGLRMALVNIKCVYSDLADPAAKQAALQINLERHRYFIDRACAQGGQFIGFPELSLNGYRFSTQMAWLRLNGPQVRAIAEKAREKAVYVSVGLAEEDDQGKHWNTQIVIGPTGRIVGRQPKRWLTKEKSFVESGSERTVFWVKGLKMGIVICADGSDYRNLKALVDQGAQLIYGAHCNSTGSTTAGWYAFRAQWAGKWNGAMGPCPTNNDGPTIEAPTSGWINQLNVYAALHNHAGRYEPAFDPPPGDQQPQRWASGAWFIGPDGQTLAQMPASQAPADSKEYLLLCDIPLPTR